MSDQVESLSAIKSSRIKWAGTPAPLTAAFERTIRARGDKRIYAENPYCEVYPMRENTYAIFSENADGASNQWAYLILGPEKALLIDDGFGIGDWRALCERLADGRPLMVANTHASYDHSYGNAWFDQVYAHKYSAAPLAALNNPHIWDYLFDENGKNIWLQFDRADLPTDRPPYSVIAVEDNYIFDLGGGYTVELIWMPGHMAGHCFYLDHVTHILYTGDGLECGRSAIAGKPKAIDPDGKQYCNVESMYRQFKRMMEMYGSEIEWVMPAHAVLDLDAAVLPGVLEGLEKIVKDPESATYKLHQIKKGKETVQYMMNCYGFTNLSFDPAYVYAPKA